MGNMPLDRLVRKLGLPKMPSKAAAQLFAQRTRESQRQGLTDDQAAIQAALNVFPNEFQAVRYAGSGDGLETVLADVEKALISSASG
jgi:hypothetical protein